MKSTARWLGIVGVCCALQACVWAPGQQVKNSDFDGGSLSKNGRYELVPITAKEVAMERATFVAPVIPAELLAYRARPYEIGTGDSLYITVWDHPELTSPAGSQQQPAANGRLVRDDGTLFYPYIGLVKAAGMTLEQLRQEIGAKLSDYVEKPQVDVAVIAYGSQQVTLRGAFIDPTPQPITVVPLTLAQALGKARIDLTSANLSDLALIRDERTYHLDIDALRRAPHGLDQVWLKPGDQLDLGFADRQQAYVTGEVLQPVTIPFKTTDITLTKALGMAGGLNETTAKGNAIYVIRGVEDMQKKPALIYQLDASSPVTFALASHFSVLPGDVVFVGPAGITRWNRFLVQLIPLSGLITNAAVSKQGFNTK